MQISAVVAVSRNHVIGFRNQLPWKLPEDLKRFREITWGHSILMGRKTFESIGRPLPGRRNLILTRNPDYRAAGAEVVSSFAEAVRLVQESSEKPSGELFVIGGSEIYEMLLPKIDRVYMTRIYQDFEGDAFFKIDEQRDFKLLKKEDFLDKPLPFSFLVWERIRPTS